MPPVCLPFLCCLVPSMLLSSEHLVSLHPPCFVISWPFPAGQSHHMCLCQFQHQGLPRFLQRKISLGLSRPTLPVRVHLVFAPVRPENRLNTIAGVPMRGSTGEFSIGASTGGSPPAAGRPHLLRWRQSRAPRWRKQPHILWLLGRVHGSAQQWVTVSPSTGLESTPLALWLPAIRPLNYNTNSGISQVV